MRSLYVVMLGALLSACASSQPVIREPAPSASAPPPATPPATTGTTRVVKSVDGTYSGEIVGNVAPNSRFAKLRIGMSMEEVNALIGAPNDLRRHETGKRWIPFYFGSDAQRLQVYYEKDGCLTYTGGNVFGGGGNALIRITPSASKTCLD